MTFAAYRVTDNSRQLWGKAGNDAISIESLTPSTADVYLNGYLMGTVANSDPLTIVGRGGNDAVTVVGTGSADTFAIAPTSIKIGTLPLTLVGITTRSIDAGAGNDTVSISGVNPDLSLLGNAGLDTFAFSDAATVGGIDGGPDGGRLDYSAYKNGVVLDTAGGTVTGVSTIANITSVVGSPQSDAPIGQPRTVTALEATGYVFKAADFALADPGDTPAHTLAAVKITTLPTAGTLVLDGQTLVAGAVVPVGDIIAGKLVYSLAANPSGSPTFTFQVQDTGGTASGGIDLDPTARTMTMIVPQINVTPTDIVLSASIVAENQPSGTVVGMLTSLDPDVSDTFTYSLVIGEGSTDNGSFTIQGNELRTAVSFDFESKASYSIRVRSTDKGGLFAEKVFTVVVTDVNDAPTGILLSALNIPVNTAIGVGIGLLSTVDQDSGDSFTYSLVEGTGGDDNASFTIDGNALKAAVVFSPSQKTNYSIRVRSTDPLGLSTERIFSLTAANVPPTFVSPATVTLPEGMPFVVTLAATDPDLGQNLVYSIAGGADASQFALNGTALLLNPMAGAQFASPTDANGDNVYEVMIAVTDGSAVVNQDIRVT
ncbi:MAG: cadherin domain-containing protein, partial [Planctomycetia bacterium]